MKDILRLYRGDSSKIKKFEFSKTYKHSLVGQGIYLTDGLSIANSYREKGTSDNGSITLNIIDCDNRQIALNQSFNIFQTLYQKENGKCKEPHLKAIYNSLIESQDIVAEYITPDLYSQVQSRYMKPSQIRAYQKQKIKENQPRIKVTWKIKEQPGRVTVFDFPENIVNHNTIHADRVIHDDGFWELMSESNCPIKIRDQTILQQVSGHEKQIFIKLRKVLEPHGYIGFEYNGGRLGGHKHRAFCLWDDEFVNDHRVNTIR